MNPENLKQLNQLKNKLAFIKRTANLKKNFLDSEFKSLENCDILEYSTQNNILIYYYVCANSGTRFFLRNIGISHLIDSPLYLKTDPDLECGKSSQILTNYIRTLALENINVSKLLGWMKIPYPSTAYFEGSEIKPYIIYYVYEYLSETFDYFLERKKFEISVCIEEDFQGNYEDFIKKFTTKLLDTIKFLHKRGAYYLNKGLFVKNNEPVLGIIKKFDEDSNKHSSRVKKDYAFVFSIYTRLISIFHTFDSEYDLFLKKELEYTS